jgi:hypothetical protein
MLGGRRTGRESVAHIWDTIDELELSMDTPQFFVLWRKYLALATQPLFSQLPAEAAGWRSVADRYDQGLLREADLTAARVSAWNFHDSVRGVVSDAVLSGWKIG